VKKILVLTIAIVLITSLGCGMHNREQETGHEDYNANLFNKVEIETDNGEIVAIATSDTTDTMIDVTLVRWATGWTDMAARDHMQEIDVHVSQDTADSVLRIYVEIPTNISYSAGCDVELRLPESLYVDLVTSNGQIDVDGHQAGMYLRTSNGKVEASNTSGNAEITTSNGEIELNNTLGDFDLNTSNGKITVYNHVGNIDAETSNGEVNADVVMPVEAGICRFESSNGRMTVSVPDSVYASIHLKTSNGDVDINGLNVDIDQMEDDEFKGSMGEGENMGEIYLKSSNGDVTLNSL